MSARLPRAVEVAVVRLRLHVDRGLHDVDLERAEMRHGAAHIFLERLLKGTAVRALEHDLAKLQQKHFFHGNFLSVNKINHNNVYPDGRSRPAHWFPNRNVRYCTASAMCCGRISADPSRSAMVRATRSTRS